MTAPAKRAPLLFDVPAGARVTQCKGCGKYVYYITTRAGKPMPVDTSVSVGGTEPTDTTAGRGISHFANCPKATLFRRPR